MATRAQVPRADGESSIGVPTKKWGNIYAYKIDEATSLGNNASLGYRQPSTTYAVGAVKHNASLPTGMYLECTTAGTTGSGALTITSPTVGGTVSDGTVTWTVRKNASTQDLTAYLLLSGGNLTGRSIGRNSTTDDMLISGGTAMATTSTPTGAYLQLIGKDLQGWGGGFSLVAANDTYTRSLSGTPAGALTWDGNSLDKSAVVAESPGVNGYRKYASGLIVQWGEGEAVEDIAGVGICMYNTFSISFTTSYSIVAVAKNISSQILGDDMFSMIYLSDISTNSKAYFKKANKSGGFSSAGGFFWRAIGY